MPSLPTRRSDWQRLVRTTWGVVRRPRWLAVALTGALGTTFLFAAVESPTYVRTVVAGGDLSAAGRVRALAAVLPIISPGGVTVHGLLQYALAGTVGANLAVLGHHLAADEVTLREGSGGVAGVALGVLGAGCASCGAAIAAGAVSVAGVGVGLALLPFDGTEFLAVALVVAICALHWLVEGTRATAIEGCPVAFDSEYR